ncbi:hypothetical protein [Streptomyces sp. SAJ15]|uniref:hypothetical protein n=1 Tax=Streptomyces sp. SAJ15 TaxID=2011095 RepID=UPI0011852ED6|nr:hypothetical protein [Streptomyces sp. SAJ15]TVL89735.1 hypothetical protein CD790_25380 [Streptomyces sp. SAJ15]
MAIPGNFLSTTTEAVDPNTSGWKPKLNCTISLGSGGRNGDGVLAVKSAAAGEMQAVTVSSYQVTPWTEYHAFCDASGATVPERIGIRWLNSSSAEISITWSMTTASASASWHRIAVGGEAPANAARAQVVVSSTPAASNVFSFYENFYFGFPKTTVGNLFAFNTETGEISAAGWLNEVNCTLGRSVPVVTWPVDFYLAGGHLVAMTVTANGNASMRSTDRPAATPGTEYVASCYLNPPTSGSTAWVELRFYDAGGSQIAATRSTLAAPGTAYYRQFASAVAPTNTASCSIAAGLDGATAGQILKVDGAVVTVAPALRTGSVLPYADASFEQGVAGWSVISGVATIARSSPWGAVFYDAAYAAVLSSATASTSVIRSAKFALPAGSGGLNFRAEVLSNLGAGGFNWTHAVRWYDAANTDLGTTAATAIPIPSPGWWVLANDFTAPASATQAALEYTVTATSTSSTWRFDRVALWQVEPAVEVEGHDDTASVTLTLRELAVGELLTVYRVTPDGTRTLVRGPSGLIFQEPITADTVIIEDYEAPLGVAVFYYVETLEVGASTPGYQTSGAVTLDPGDRNEAWLKDPGQPQRNLKVMVQRGPDWQRSVEQTEHRIRGRRNSVVLSDVRGGLEGDLVIWTRSDDERTGLHWLLDSGNVLLFQAVPGMGVADVYVAVGQITEARVSSFGPETLRSWTLPLRQVDMPVSTGVAGSAGRTWQDALTGHASWQAVLDAYETWEDVVFDERIGG